jgi:AraC family transcriptional regulator of adaptative response / DNA-3-methyladenine glycosylase II
VQISLPSGYPLEALRRSLIRDPVSCNERLEGNEYRAALLLEGEPHLVHLRLEHDRVTLIGEQPLALVRALLGLDQPVDAFVDHVQGLGLGRLVDGCPQLRLHQALSVFDALLWTITGQQINLAFAYKLKRKMVERWGTPVGELYAPPGPAVMAALEPADLLPLQFSRQKADYLVGVSRLVASGALDLEALRHLSVPEVERTLLAVRGLGVWSVNYLMLRALGFPDCVPVGDTGLSSGLWKFFGTELRPDANATRALMLPLAPYRSLATAHLWRLS